MHRHEPPILGGKIKIYHRDDENGVWVVEKKASMPIHATGRYRKNTLLEVLKNEYGLEHVNSEFIQYICFDCPLSFLNWRYGADILCI